MAKLVVLASTRAIVPATDKDSFSQWLLTQHGPKVLAALADRVVVQRPMPAADGGPPLFDAVIELWSDHALADAIAADADLTERARLEICPSEEVIGKAGPAPVKAGATAGISQITFVAPLDGLTHEETLRHWSEHIPLACDIHIGMNRYVQDRLKPGTTRWFGMAHLHFPDETALRDRLFRSPEDIPVITADVAEFVGDYATMLATEHVIKA